MRNEYGKNSVPFCFLLSNRFICTCVYKEYEVINNGRRDREIPAAIVVY